jgi:hypothetical protein
MKRDTKARRDNAEREGVRRFNATLEREATRMQAAHGRTVTATVRACMDIAGQWIDARIAYGFPARFIATEAIGQFSTEFADVGLCPDTMPEAVKAFRAAVSKHHWRSLHAGRKRAGMSRNVEKLASDRAARNAQLGVYIGKPECRMLLLQAVIERNMGIDDAVVLRALDMAHEWAPPETGNPADGVTAAHRVIIDLNPEHKAAQSTFIVHKPGHAPELHAA